MIECEVWSIKIAGRQFVQGQAGAFRALCSCVVFALSSSPPFLCPRCSAAAASLFCLLLLTPLLWGRRRMKRLSKLYYFLPAASISLFWEFDPRTAFSVVKAGHFGIFPCLLSDWWENTRWKWKAGDSPSECHQLSRLAQVKVLQAVIPSLISIIPRFVAKRELDRDRVSIYWDPVIRSGAARKKGGCGPWGQPWGQFHEVLFAAKSQLTAALLFTTFKWA